MTPGEMFIKDGEIELNSGRKTAKITVANSGDRPIQVGSHYHFFETNAALKFERQQIVRIKSGIRILSSDQTSKQQARREREHERDADLCNDQGIAERVPALAASGTGRAILQCDEHVDLAARGVPLGRGARPPP